MSGIPLWAHVGAKVVCVPYMDADRTKEVTEVRKGTIVTVTYAGISGDGWPAIRVRELEGFYRLRNFRPLVTLETDIATHFSHHLHAPQKIVERAS